MPHLEEMIGSHGSSTCATVCRRNTLRLKPIHHGGKPCEPGLDSVENSTLSLRHGLERWSDVLGGNHVPFQTVAHETGPCSITRSVMSTACHQASA